MTIIIIILSDITDVWQYDYNITLILILNLNKRKKKLNKKLSLQIINLVFF